MLDKPNDRLYIRLNKIKPPPRLLVRERAKEVVMCRIATEGVQFPFPELPGAPKTRGTVTIHRDGGWTFETVEGGVALRHVVVISSEGGPLTVESEISGEVPPGEGEYYTGEYPRV
jgi:hypothetical protein